MPPDTKKPKKLIGPGFWIMVFITGVKDLMDALGDLSIVLSVMSVITGFIVAFILGIYFFFNGVKPTTKKITTFALTTILGMIPFLNFLPETVFNLFMIRWFENNEKIKKVVDNKLTANISKVV